MRKITALIIALLFGIFAMAYIYFTNLKNEENTADRALNLVSSHASIIFTFENDKTFYDILSGQAILNDVVGKQKAKTLQHIYQNWVKLAPISKVLDGKKVYIGITNGEKDNVDFLLATQFSAKNTVDIGAFAAANQVKLNKVEDHIFEATLSDTTKCYITVEKQTVLIASSLHTLSQLKTTATHHNDFASYIRKGNLRQKNTLANVYINFKTLPTVLKAVVQQQINGELEVLAKANAFAALSYNYATDKLLLNGYTELIDNTHYLSLFKNQPEQKVTIDQLLPEKTANYTIYGFADYKKWLDKLTDWFRENDKKTNTQALAKRTVDKYGIDLKSTFPEFTTNQFATFQIHTGERFGIVALKNGDKFNQLLLDLSTEYSTTTRNFKEAGIPYAFFGTPFKKFKRPFYTVIDNHLIMANNASSIQRFLNDYMANKLLINDSLYIRFKDQCADAASVSYYINRSNSANIFGRNLKARFYKQYLSKDGFKAYNAFGLQMSADAGQFLTNVLLLKKQPEVALDSLAN